MDAAQRDAIASLLEPELKPYRDSHTRWSALPDAGRDRAAVLAELRDLHEREQPRWSEGFASGAVYSGDPAHVAFLDEVYALFSQANPLHVDLWPSVTKFEAEIVAMTAAMLHGTAPYAPDACGTVTSGGTESILLAMKTYRDHARAVRGITEPKIVAPVTAHAAFDKAAQYFGIELVKVGVGPDMRADVAQVRAAVDERTIAVVGSAVQFPHGVLDPIADLAAIAAEAGCGMHTDSCLGGFVLAWAADLGYPVPPFDFRVPGVTSMSCDPHKYGFTAKGVSTVLYRDPDLREFQYFTTTGWPGGLYMTPTFAGSRPGALPAMAWAAMMTIGADGYRQASRQILAAGARVAAGVGEIPGLRVLGDPLWVVAFASEEVDVHAVNHRMTRRGWSLNGLQNPAAVHLCVTLRHAQPGVVDRFLADLAACVDEVRADPADTGMMAPVYGMAANPAMSGEVDALMRGYLDTVYRV